MMEGWMMGGLLDGGMDKGGEKILLGMCDEQEGGVWGEWVRWVWG